MKYKNNEPNFQYRNSGLSRLLVLLWFSNSSYATASYLRLALGAFLIGSRTTNCAQGLGTCLDINTVVSWGLAALPAQNPKPQGTRGDWNHLDIQSEINPGPHWGRGKKGRCWSTLASHRMARNCRSQQSLAFFLGDGRPSMKCSMWDLGSLTRDRTHAPCSEAWSLPRWTIRECPTWLSYQAFYRVLT